jgi:uncharacterized membrane protein
VTAEEAEVTFLLLTTGSSYVLGCVLLISCTGSSLEASAPPVGIGYLETPSLDILVHWIVLILEWAGIVVTLGGTVVATGEVVHQIIRFGLSWAVYQRYRKHLGQAILLGLEFLVAADIIRTVAVAPTFENVGVLGLIIVIRTFLSFALEVETTGTWPWQQQSITGE